MLLVKNSLHNLIEIIDLH